MARLTRLVMVLSSVVGFSVAAPASSQAGVIPWVYDAIFGPVGSLRAGRAYTPTYTAGYWGGGGGYGSGGMAYTGYSPMTVAYTPTMAASYGSYGNNCACNQSTGYPMTTAYDSYGGGSNCNSCATGNCSSGVGQTTRYPSPSPDPNYSQRDLLHRLDELEHNQRELTRFLKKQHPDDWNPDPFKQKTYSRDKGFGGSSTEETVRQRGTGSRRSDTIESESGAPDPFARPKKTGDPEDNEFRHQNQKPEISPPSTEPEKAVEPSKPVESEPAAFRVDRQVTTRAVTPRERIQIGATTPKASIAKSNSNRSKMWLDSSNSGELARH